MVKIRKIVKEPSSPPRVSLGSGNCHPLYLHYRTNFHSERNLEGLLFLWQLENGFQKASGLRDLAGQASPMKC